MKSSLFINKISLNNNNHSPQFVRDTIILLHYHHHHCHQLKHHVFSLLINWRDRKKTHKFICMYSYNIELSFFCCSCTTSHTVLILYQKNVINVLLNCFVLFCLRLNGIKNNVFSHFNLIFTQKWPSLIMCMESHLLGNERSDQKQN